MAEAPGTVGRVGRDVARMLLGRSHPSLQRHILAWMLVPLGGVAIFKIATSYQDAARTADLVFDRTLLASGRVIAEQMRADGNMIEAPVSPAALEMFASDVRDLVAYRVVGPGNKLITGTPELGLPDTLPTGFAVLPYRTTFRQTPVRAMAVAQPIVLASGTVQTVVMVGQTLNGYDAMLRSLWLKSLRDQILILVAVGLLAVYGLRRCLSPLLGLRRAVAERQADVLEPLSTYGVQTSYSPSSRR